MNQIRAFLIEPGMLLQRICVARITLHFVNRPAMGCLFAVPV
jgi:hypothetical protein